ncbi:MAG: tetratricopeptide repeat protein [Candidatus Krumholzibacteria bacterium]|nr:tetratricopeptide repeat protein [Candidatus Krumholzibacteria bacterium]
MGKIFGISKNPEYELGIKLYNEGKYELAVAELEKAIPKAGKDDPIYALGMFYAAESHAHIGTAKFLAGDANEALVHFRKVVEENPTYPDIYYRMGVIHHRLGNTSESIENLRKAVELNSNYFEAICYLGIVLYEKGERDEADVVFKKALKIGSETPSPISKFLSDHLAGRETDIPPLASLKQVIRSDAEFEAAAKEGIEAYNTGNFEEAVRALSTACNDHPDYADVRFKLALAHLRRGDNEDAQREFKAAISINPQYAEAHFYLGIAQLDNKLYREAIEQFERAAAIKPDYADLQCFLGSTYFYLGELDKARVSLEASLALSPGYGKARYYYGLLLYALGDRKRAIEFLADATKGEERKGAVDLSFALVHLREGNLEEAMAVLKDILDAGGESADVLYFLGECYLRMDKLADAERFFRRALQINPRFLRAKEKLALVFIRNGDYGAAEKMLDPPEADFADLSKILGDIKFYRGELEAAERFYRKSLDVNSEYSEANLSLALTLRNEGREAEAEELLKRLIEHDPENVLARNLLGRGPLDFETHKSEG